jgi:hypothetical protein
MSTGRVSLYCFNPLTGKRDGGYCVWQGGGKCIKCQAEDTITQLQAERQQTVHMLQCLNGDQAEEIAELQAELSTIRRCISMERYERDDGSYDYGLGWESPAELYAALEVGADLS